MQQSSPMSKLGPVWTVFQFLWNIRKIVTIILLVLTLVYLFFAETLQQRRFMLTQFSEAQAVITDLEAEMKRLGDEAFSGPSRDGRSITSIQAHELYAGVQDLRSELATLAPPNAALEIARNSYVNSLTVLLGRLNLFEEGEDSTVSILRALEGIEVPAANYREAAKRYQNSVWRNFWAAF